MSVLRDIEAWYSAQCNGDWEHQYGVTIDTLDNPGWTVRIDLRHTQLEGRAFTRMVAERTETDWLNCWVEDGRFNGAGGAQNLHEILSVFLSWGAPQP